MTIKSVTVWWWQCNGDNGPMWQKVRLFDKYGWQMLHCTIKSVTCNGDIEQM